MSFWRFLLYVVGLGVVVFGFSAAATFVLRLAP